MFVAASMMDECHVQACVRRAGLPGPSCAGVVMQLVTRLSVLELVMYAEHFLFIASNKRFLMQVSESAALSELYACNGRACSMRCMPVYLHSMKLPLDTAWKEAIP